MGREEVKLSGSRGRRPLVREIDDVALVWTVDGAVRRVHEVCHITRVPVIPACLPLLTVHALLDDGPLAVIGDEETVQIEIEAVLHGSAVDLGHQTAGAGEGGSIKTDAVAQRVQFFGRAPGVLSAAAANMDAELTAYGREPTFKRADDAGCDARGMPIHAHDGAEGLEPEGM